MLAGQCRDGPDLRCELWLLRRDQRGLCEVLPVPLALAHFRAGCLMAATLRHRNQMRGGAVTVTPSSVPTSPPSEPPMPDVCRSRLSAAPLEQLAKDNAIFLSPVGAIKQHGPHLATGTDAFLCVEACIKTARLVRKVRPIVVAPAVWMRLSEHHIACGSTSTASLATWHSILRDLCLSVLRCDFRRIMIVNGHADNMTALTVLTTELTLGNPGCYREHELSCVRDG